MLYIIIMFVYGTIKKTHCVRVMYIRKSDVTGKTFSVSGRDVPVEYNTMYICKSIIKNYYEVTSPFSSSSS